ncbi:DUF934 domain-containing protein [Halomonas lysinitropha]|uniref:DUF934 domain-containing protein n=1 Tax=Halomonas lysinitropha TaxID=2607506 RepID=A0A5K1IA25_9GAMM|nr:DUF934 domain-containing protein [Halomonas lysinitropha]VVZ97327.1 hypothetical protein HALO32_03444 [Halomonas lysinitropha]
MPNDNAPDQQLEHARTLIKMGQPEQDEWALSRDEQAMPSRRPVIVPFTLWQQLPGEEGLAPWLPSDTELDDTLAAALSAAPLVAIDFPAFTDGRGYTLARLLRERYGYGGEVRAIGDVLVDQLFYMTRCGFDALALREDQQLEDALRALGAFSVSYQPAVDMGEAIFERRLRENGHA